MPGVCKGVFALERIGAPVDVVGGWSSDVGWMPGCTPEVGWLAGFVPLPVAPTLGSPLAAAPLSALRLPPFGAAVATSSVGSHLFSGVLKKATAASVETASFPFATGDCCDDTAASPGFRSSDTPSLSSPLISLPFPGPSGAFPSSLESALGWTACTAAVSLIPSRAPSAASPVSAPPAPRSVVPSPAPSSHANRVNRPAVLAGRRPPAGE